MTTTYTLIYPVELKSKAGDSMETITELQLKRFNGADMKAIANAKAKGEGEMMAVMLCRSASIPPSTFDLLDGEDITAAGEIAAGFIGRVQTTGSQ
jgi:hypothetical protein